MTMQHATASRTSSDSGFTLHHLQSTVIDCYYTINRPTTPLVYTNYMRLLFALGNIGPHYNNPRHNIGFAMLDAFAAHHNLEWHAKDKLKTLIAEGTVD